MNPIDQGATNRIVSCFAVFALSLASAACSESAAPPRAPATFTGAAACHVTSPAKVLAKRVFVPGGVSASEQDGRFTVRFATAASHCVSVPWPSESDRTSPESCPTTSARTAARTNAEPTLLAWESHDEIEPHIKLGVVTYDAPQAWLGPEVEGPRRIAERTFYPPAEGRQDGETTPALASIGHDRFLLAWVEGNVESHQLRAQSIVGWGDPLGPSMILSPSNASVIGRPSLVVAPTGYGLVTYVASVDGEFDVLATPVACAEN